MQLVSKQVVSNPLILILDETAVAIIWRMPKASRLSNRARFAIGVIAESGLLYTLTSIITFCSLFSQNKTIWFSTVNEVVSYKCVKRC